MEQVVAKAIEAALELTKLPSEANRTTQGNVRYPPPIIGNNGLTPVLYPLPPL